jgi:hypothetical protein
MLSNTNTHALSLGHYMSLLFLCLSDTQDLEPLLPYGQTHLIIIYHYSMPQFVNSHVPLTEKSMMKKN